MQIVLVGTNHRSADISVREQLVFSDEQSVATLSNWTGSDKVKEVMILSTCNRVEVIAITPDATPQIGPDRIARLLGDSKISKSEFGKHIYTYVDEDAIRHIFRVASSLDSMVIGEPQILGQLRKAFVLARETGTVGPTLNKLLPQAFHVAKRVRNETDIASSAVSVSYMAVELGRKIFESLENRKVLLIGGGPTAELAARHLIKCGASGVMFTNRTYAKAEELAAKFGGKAGPIDCLADHLAEADIVICSTSSPNFIVTPELMSTARARRRRTPLFLIDISVPRNIDPRLGAMDNFFVFNIDDLKTLVLSNIDRRLREAHQAEAIVEQEVVRFREVLQSMKLGPVIARLRKRMSEIATEELARHRSKLSSLSTEQEKAVEALLFSTLNKVAHPIITQMRKDALEIEL